MKKKLTTKLELNRETLRTLTPRNLTEVQGGAWSDLCDTGGSNTTDTDTCFGPDC